MAEILPPNPYAMSVGQSKEPLVSAQAVPADTTEIEPQTNGEVKAQSEYPPGIVGIASQPNGDEVKAQSEYPPGIVGIASTQSADVSNGTFEALESAVEYQTKQVESIAIGGGVESAACRAGDWQYLFFNRNNAAEIDFYRVSEKTRTPIHYYVNLKTVDPSSGKPITTQKLSSGGSIAAVYIKRTDCVQLYYISKLAPGKRVHRLAEVTLVNASKAAEPSTWIPGGLMRKNIAIDKESFLCATLDEDENPHAYYQGDEDLDSVSVAKFEKLNGAPKSYDWEYTKFTGLLS